MRTYRMKVDVVLLEDYEALADKLATALREKQAYQEQGVRAVQRANEAEDALAAQRRVADDALTELHAYMDRVNGLEERILRAEKELDEAHHLTRAADGGVEVLQDHIRQASDQIGKLRARNEELEEAVRLQADVIAKLQIERSRHATDLGDA